MILHILVMRDSAADVFGTPTFHTTIGAAIRTFGDEVNRQKEGNVLSEHPADFELYRIGTYDDADAKIELLEKPVSVARGADFAQKRKA